MYRLLKQLGAYPSIVNSYAFGEFAHASFGNEVSENDLTGFLGDKGLNAIKIERTEPTIEDCFIQLLKN